MEVIELELDRVIPYENNPNAHPPSQIEKLAKSIQEFGFKVPIVVDKDFVIIAGHGRYQAAKKLGLKRVPVIIATDLTPEQVRAFRIADNRLALESNWDLDRLSEELKALIDEGYDVGLTFLDKKEIEFFVQQALDDLEEEFDPYEEWRGMPEFIAEDKTAYKQVIINFETKADLEAFINLTNLNITDKTRSVWFPPREKDNLIDYGWKVIEDGEGE